MNNTECTVQTPLNIPLTPKQVQAKAKDVITLMEEMREKEEKHKVVMREYNAEKRRNQITIDGLCRDYDAKTEEREVECTQHFDLDTEETWYIYEGSEYERRSMEPHEVAKVRQGTIFNDGPDLPGVVRDGDNDGGTGDDPLLSSHDISDRPFDEGLAVVPD